MKKTMQYACLILKLKRAADDRIVYVNMANVDSFNTNNHGNTDINFSNGNTYITVKETLEEIANELGME